MADKFNVDTTESRIARLSKDLHKMSLERSLQIMVAAGLTTEESAQAALARAADAKATVDARRRKKTRNTADGR